MNINIKIVKLVISLRVAVIFYSNSLNDFQLLASLKTLNNLRALSDVRAPPLDCIPDKPIKSSMIEKHTIEQSNKLKASLAYSFNPRPVNFINNSVKNTSDNILL